MVQVVRQISYRHNKDTCSVSCEGFLYLSFFTTQQELKTGWGELSFFFFKKKGMSTMKINVKNKAKIDKWLLPLNLTSCVSENISVVVMNVN